MGKTNIFTHMWSTRIAHFSTIYITCGFEVYTKQGNNAKALECFQKALDIRKSILGVGHPDTIQVKGEVDSLLRKMGKE